VLQLLNLPILLPNRSLHAVSQKYGRPFRRDFPPMNCTAFNDMVLRFIDFFRPLGQSLPPYHTFFSPLPPLLVVHWRILPLDVPFIKGTNPPWSGPQVIRWSINSKFDHVQLELLHLPKHHVLRNPVPPLPPQLFCAWLVLRPHLTYSEGETQISTKSLLFVPSTKTSVPGFFFQKSLLGRSMKNS